MFPINTMVLPSNISAFDYGSGTLYLFQDAEELAVTCEQADAIKICHVNLPMQQKLSCCRLLDSSKIVCGMWNAICVIDTQKKQLVDCEISGLPILIGKDFAILSSSLCLFFKLDDGSITVIG